MEKKSIIGLLVILLIILIYPYYVNKFSPPSKISSPAIIKQREVVQPAELTPVLPLAKEQPLAFKQADTVHDTVLQNSRIWVKLTNQGAAIKEIRLIRFKDSENENGLSICEINSYDKNIFGWVDAFFGYELNSPNYEYTEEKGRVTYRLILPGLVEVEKIFYLEEDSDLIKTEVRLKNLGDKPLPSAFSLLVAGGLSTKEAFEERYLELDVFYQGKIQRNPLGALKKGKDYIGPVSWLAVKNKYFCQVLTPLSDKISFAAKAEGKNVMVVARMPTTIIPPQGMREERFSLFVGPLDTNLLAQYNSSWREIINFGMFDSIAKFILNMLKNVYAIFKNYGIAIILLSILVNVVLFPFTWKGLKSMQRLQALQPQMDVLKKEYAKDPQKLNREIMELYRKNKVNPFGGCLPMILQMPVFIALYQALSRAIQLKGASFLWIKDLAAPDALIRFQSSLPFLGNSFNLLPVIMIIGTFLQQKKSQAYAAASQKQMTWFMPLFMGLIFYNLPSGLILYWAVSTFLNVGLQSLPFARHSPEGVARGL